MGRKQPTAYTAKFLTASSLQKGAWSNSLFGCCSDGDYLPQICMPCCCPYVSLAQITARTRILSYWTVMILVFLSFIIELAVIVADSMADPSTKYYVAAMIVSCTIWFMSVGAVTFVRLRVRQLFYIPGNVCMDFCASWWCICCTLSQLATHTKSYKPKSCSFGPVDAIPAYQV